LGNLRQVTQALGRVLQRDELEGPRGPDGRLRVTVPRGWLAEGRSIELEVPRMLECARCGGGGCDGCERSGAVTTRGRKEPPELIDLHLPASSQAVTVRLPRRGGLPSDETPDLARGLMLLLVVPGDEPSAGVRVVEVAAQPAAVSAPTLAARYALTPARLLVAAAVLLIVLCVFVATR